MTMLTCFGVMNSMFYRNFVPSLHSDQLKYAYVAVRCYAARKGTREKARKKKVKKEVQVKEFIPYKVRLLQQQRASAPSKRVDYSYKPLSEDNVWVSKFFKPVEFSFSEAAKCHVETHHPTVYNRLDSFLEVNLEFDMTAKKKNRYVDKFTRFLVMPYEFDHGQNRTVLAFCKTPEIQKEALNSGAAVAGDTELIKEIESGKFSLQDFDILVAHPNILPELTAVRGLIPRGKLPNYRHGTLGIEIGELVKKFVKGIQYTCEKDEFEHDYGFFKAPIGTLNMDVSNLESNFSALINDVLSVRPQRDGPFITACYLTSEPSSEKLKVDISSYEKEKQGSLSGEEDGTDDEEEVTEKETKVAQL